MKVAIVHEMLIKLGGAERVVLELQKIFPDAQLFTSIFDRKKCGAVFDEKKVRTSFLQKYFRAGVPLNFLRLKMLAAFESFDFSGFDLIVSSTSAFAHSILVAPPARHVCFCHSPARFFWDWHFQILRDENFSKLVKFFFKNFAHRARTFDFAAAARPDKILSNSKNVQKRIKKFWRRESEIVYPPVSVEKFMPAKKHENYFLIVSALQKFKRIDLAVRVFSKLPKHKLVIIGDGDEREFLENIAGENVEFLGRKSDATVREFIQNCRAFIFPGLDDFGIAPVEAAAAGKPVVAFGAGGILESARENFSAVFFRENSEESLRDALIRFFEIEENFDAGAISSAVKKFSTKNFRENFLRAAQIRDWV